MTHGSSPRCLLLALRSALLTLTVAHIACLPCVPGIEVLCDEEEVVPDAGLQEGHDCNELCVIESGCDLRSYETCVRESCEGPFRKPSGDTDECMLAVEDCAEVAACTCAGSCARLDVCTGSLDPGCEATCDVLLEQEPIETFQENRCRIESACEELAACGGL
jgi:hypothetical protein